MYNECPSRGVIGFAHFLTDGAKTSDRGNSSMICYKQHISGHELNELSV